MPVPPEAIWEVLADPASYGYWVVGSKAIRDAEPGWPAQGSKFHHTVGAGPLKVADHTEAVEVEPPRLLKLRAKGRPAGTATVTMRDDPQAAGRRDRGADDREPRQRVRGPDPEPAHPRVHDRPQQPSR
ncbi:MAG: SRPBCC family protein [Thermoleophilaceae bacterium]